MMGLDSRLKEVSPHFWPLLLLLLFTPLITLLAEAWLLLLLAAGFRTTAVRTPCGTGALRALLRFHGT